MPLAALLALTLLAAQQGDAPIATAPSASAPAPMDKPAVAEPVADEDGIPPGAPTEDYPFVAWCYGATEEYLEIYDRIKPDLKAIDKMFGTPVKEAEPYQSDVAEEHKALKRFSAAITAAEKASVHPIAEEGVEAMALGRSIWRAAELQPSRKLADAWLFWGIPTRCEKTAATLKTRSILMGQALAQHAPKAEPVAAEIAKPAVAQPEVAQPDAAKPDVPQPDTPKTEDPIGSALESANKPAPAEAPAMPASPSTETPVAADPKA
jgi:hypothetical protein